MAMNIAVTVISELPRQEPRILPSDTDK